ncbi:MAG TPA: hypothetical protein VF576_05190, partial [Rubricoccaceae bacterium]
MRSAAVLLVAAVLTACDSQGGPDRDALVGAWTADSSGTAESVTPTFTGPVVNFAARPTGGEATISGRVSAALRFARLGPSGPRGHREATFASWLGSGRAPKRSGTSASGVGSAGVGGSS